MNIEDISPERRDDVQEIQNYVNAMNFGIKRIVNDDFPFCCRLIREIHREVLKGVRGEHKTPGKFRYSQNFIGGTMPSNAVYVPPAVIDMKEALNDFDKFINTDYRIPELVKIAMLHYQFETIHPFLDGNGRTGRLIIPLYLLSKKELNKHCFYISDYFEKNRTEYYDALQRVRTQNDMIGWIKFFLKASINTAETAKNKFRNAVNLVQEYKEYIMEQDRSSKRFQQVFRYLYSVPVASANDISNATGISIPTVSKTLNAMLKDNILIELTGYKRNSIFALWKYIDVFKQ